MVLDDDAEELDEPDDNSPVIVPEMRSRPDDVEVDAGAQLSPLPLLAPSWRLPGTGVCVRGVTVAEDDGAEARTVNVQWRRSNDSTLLS